ncbi:hypothetical protein [Shewanella donghaensis]|uniref:hypothetical protein n=1 Tax=Shewanella donghaensis TaxID=238836 RepID=UPI0011838417|nr:hypothetical protein [Shewanella donghaensis]
MQIKIDNTIINQQSQTQATTRPERPHGPPPPGSTPPGLETAVETLTDDEQSDISTMLASLTEEQQQSLKMALDELKPMADKLSKNDMGSVFLETLTQISSASSTDSGADKVDTYA